MKEYNINITEKCQIHQRRYKSFKSYVRIINISLAVIKDMFQLTTTKLLEYTSLFV